MKITDQSQIIHGSFIQTGRGLKSVRVITPNSNEEGGFATTTYNFAMSNEMQEYSAERIALAMRLLKGVSNQGIIEMIALRESKQERKKTD
ncbi:hypothetical protein F7U66_01400 [Vibrio parahaemolyticus]|nr:hypothetical protein [Vibrio parahaemolyticus]